MPMRFSLSLSGLLRGLSVGLLPLGLMALRGFLSRRSFGRFLLASPAMVLVDFHDDW